MTMTLDEYCAQERGRQITLARLLGTASAVVSNWCSGNRTVPAELAADIERATCGVVTRKDLFPDTWASIWPELDDHATELRAAILQTRAVFASESAAGDALNYLESVLASAPVPAQTGTSTTEQAADTTTTIIAKLAVDIDTSAITAALVLAEQLKQSLGNLATLDDLSVSVAPPPSAADQAAAAMAAESAQLVADAERTVAARAEPLTLQQVDKVEDRMLALLAEPLTREQRELVRTDMVAEFRALNAMGVQPPVVLS